MLQEQRGRIQRENRQRLTVSVANNSEARHINDSTARTMHGSLVVKGARDSHDVPLKVKTHIEFMEVKYGL